MVMAAPMNVYNTSLPLPALQRLDHCLNALSSNLYRSVLEGLDTAGGVIYCTQFLPNHPCPPVTTLNHSNFRSVQWRPRGGVDAFASTCKH